MDLNRGTLAKIDRKVLSALGRDETYQMVRVPVTEAKWSTWKRYCDAAGISMGRAIVAPLRTTSGARRTSHLRHRRHLRHRLDRRKANRRRRW